MQDVTRLMDVPMTGLDAAVWRNRLANICKELGEYRPLGKRHFATFIRQKPSLLVTFETVQGIRALSETAQPFGFEMVRARGWSHLCLVSDGDTWFRDADVYAYFDQLIDDGFFEDFDHVLFYGAGPCGYAASAFSVAAPGATVVAVQPQATLDARRTEWDPRFTEMRKVSFTDRFGYAPDMLDAAHHAYVLYDPREDLDAMHATLFVRPNVSRLRLPNMGGALQTRLVEMEILYPILTLAGIGKLSKKSFYRLYRARHNNVPYLRSLLGKLDAEDRPYLATLLCRSVTTRMHAPRFRQRLEQLEQTAQEGAFALPPERATPSL